MAQPRVAGREKVAGGPLRAVQVPGVDHVQSGGNVAGPLPDETAAVHRVADHWTEAPSLGATRWVLPARLAVPADPGNADRPGAFVPCPRPPEVGHQGAATRAYLAYP